MVAVDLLQGRLMAKLPAYRDAPISALALRYLVPIGPVIVLVLVGPSPNWSIPSHHSPSPIPSPSWYLVPIGLVLVIVLFLVLAGT